jgi:hypothetical protein
MAGHLVLIERIERERERERERDPSTFCSEELEERNYLENLGFNDRITLKIIMYK